MFSQNTGRVRESERAGADEWRRRSKEKGKEPGKRGKREGIVWCWGWGKRVVGAAEGRGGTERRIRKKAEARRLGQGVGSGARGEQALVPVLIFTAKASSWSGTRRSVSSLATMPMMWYSSFGLRSRSMAVMLAMTVPGSADSSTLTVWMGLRNSGRESLMSSIRIVMVAVPERGTVPLSVATTVSL